MSRVYTLVGKTTDTVLINTRSAQEAPVPNIDTTTLGLLCGCLGRM